MEELVLAAGPGSAEPRLSKCPGGVYAYDVALASTANGLSTSDCASSNFMSERFNLLPVYLLISNAYSDGNSTSSTLLPS